MIPNTAGPGGLGGPASLSLTPSQARDSARERLVPGLQAGPIQVMPVPLTRTLMPRQRAIHDPNHRESAALRRSKTHVPVHCTFVK